AVKIPNAKGVRRAPVATPGTAQPAAVTPASARVSRDEPTIDWQGKGREPPSTAAPAAQQPMMSPAPPNQQQQPLMHTPAIEPLPPLIPQIATWPSTPGLFRLVNEQEPAPPGDKDDPNAPPDDPNKKKEEQKFGRAP